MEGAAGPRVDTAAPADRTLSLRYAVTPEPIALRIWRARPGAAWRTAPCPGQATLLTYFGRRKTRSGGPVSGLSGRGRRARGFGGEKDELPILVVAEARKGLSLELFDHGQSRGKQGLAGVCQG